MSSYLSLLPGDSAGPPKRGEIPIQDLADLLLLTVKQNGANGQMLSKSTAICSTVNVAGPTDWTELAKTVRK
jgi:hypothetical protein